MFTVAIVGRANVGKSTLFNRLTGEKKAITADHPGTTRDRLYGQVTWNDRSFNLVDTAGLEAADESGFDVGSQIKLALEEADLIIFIVDVTIGLTQKDSNAAKIILKSGKPFVVAANKYDADKYLSNLQEFYRLGADEIVATSALNGRGTGDLMDALTNKMADLPKQERLLVTEDGIKTAIVGRPNVGKSSLLNQLLGENRALVSEKAGTTRDVNTAELDIDGEKIFFLDTAGIRRRGKVGKVEEGKREGQIEKYSVIRSMKAIEEAEIVLALIDATEGVTAQDLHILGYALEKHKSTIIVVNKWDLSEEETNIYLQHLKHKINFLPYAPVIFVSAKTGKNVGKIIGLIIAAHKQRTKRVPTSELNLMLRQDILIKAPSAKRGILPKISYMTQAEVNPPTFIIFTNHPELIHFSYKRYLENRIREHWDFEMTPINLIFKKKNE